LVVQRNSYLAISKSNKNKINPYWRPFGAGTQ
jgi:hypothetical protein